MNLTKQYNTLNTGIEGDYKLLRAKAEITFTLPDRYYRWNKHFRPVFRFGDGLLFSGIILGDTVEYIPNQTYLVDIDFFTVEDEAFAALQPMLKAGMGLTIQEGARITGIAKLVDFAYS
jgi:hypothetical protein